MVVVEAAADNNSLALRLYVQRRSVPHRVAQPRNAPCPPRLNREPTTSRAVQPTAKQQFLTATDHSTHVSRWRFSPASNRLQTHQHEERNPRRPVSGSYRPYRLFHEGDSARAVAWSLPEAIHWTHHETAGELVIRILEACSRRAC